MRAIVRTLYDDTEAKAIGASHEFEIVVLTLSHVAGGMLATDNQASSPNLDYVLGEHHFFRPDYRGIVRR